MKIGILTFHWATNYGAVLQAYALQEYILSEFPQCEVEIINYIPIKPNSIVSCLKGRNLRRIIGIIKDCCKEKKIASFRLKHLILSREFKSYEELKNIKQYDAIICGSDQIWNPWFTMNGEKKITLSYYLAFTNCSKIAYAASFGCTEYPENLFPVLAPLLKEYKKIGVREDSAVRILNNMGIENASVVADPTALLSSECLKELASGEKNRNCAVYYILHGKSNSKTAAIKMFTELFKFQNTPFINIDNTDMDTWINEIENAKFMVTNSYHGMMMCIKFHVPFAVLPEDGGREGMNDRFTTLLKKLRLENRIIPNCSKKNAEMLMKIVINWDEIDQKMHEYIEFSKDFIRNALE